MAQCPDHSSSLRKHMHCVEKVAAWANLTTRTTSYSRTPSQSCHSSSVGRATVCLHSKHPGRYYTLYFVAFVDMHRTFEGVWGALRGDIVPSASRSEFPILRLGAVVDTLHATRAGEDVLETLSLHVWNRAYFHTGCRMEYLQSIGRDRGDWSSGARLQFHDGRDPGKKPAHLSLRPQPCTAMLNIVDSYWAVVEISLETALASRSVAI